MAEDSLLRRVAATSWTNFHGTVTVPIKALWEIENPSTAASLQRFRETAERLQRLINHACDSGERLRAVGSRWSFSEVAAAKDGWALRTSALNYQFSVGPAFFDAKFKGKAGELILAQCGRSVAEVNKAIETKERRRALNTSGASNGQTVAGVIGTGVHGSAIDVGAMESQVAGLHLLTGARSIWLEHPDRPTLNEDFAREIGAELVRDALLFRAALVSLGALGVVHAVLLRTTERYLLRSFLRKMKLAEVQSTMDSLDFTGVALPKPGVRPYFFQVIVTPSAGEDVVHVTTRYKETCKPDYVPDYRLETGYEAGNDLPGAIQKLIGGVPALTPALVKLLMAQELKPFEDKIGTPGEIYDFTSAKKGSAGAALAVPAGRTTEAVAVARKAFAAGKFAPIIFACRYARGSEGLLSFAQYERTCIIDIDGLDMPETRKMMEAIRTAFDAAQIPYSQHWGKLHGLTKDRVSRSYGSKITDWNKARHMLLPTPKQRHAFSTDLLQSIGLAD